MENLENKRTKCLTYSRVCGWIVPYQSFNPGKRSERNDMKQYNYDISLEHQFNC